MDSENVIHRESGPICQFVEPFACKPSGHQVKKRLTQRIGICLILQSIGITDGFLQLLSLSGPIGHDPHRNRVDWIGHIVPSVT